MPTNRRQSLGWAAAMVLVAGGSPLLVPKTLLAATRPPVALTDLFPVAFAGWQADDSLPVVLPSPDVQARLDQIYSQLLTRTYINTAGSRIMLSVAYGQNQSDTTQVHRPEVCYPSQGFQLLAARDAELTIGAARRLPVRRIETRLNNRVEPVTYWLVVGDVAAVNRTQQKLAQLGYVVRGLVADGMLVRVSSIDSDVARSFELQNGFIRQLFAAIPPPAVERVFGRVAS
jgi:EpsI family protein